MYTLTGTVTASTKLPYSSYQSLIFTLNDNTSLLNDTHFIHVIHFSPF